MDILIKEDDSKIISIFLFYFKIQKNIIKLKNGIVNTGQMENAVIV